MNGIGKRQNRLLPEHIDKILDTYQHRREEPRYSMRVSMERIEKESYNLNISRYISTAEAAVDLSAIHAELLTLTQAIETAREKHNAFLKQLDLPLLP